MGLTKYFHVKYSDKGSSFAFFGALASASSNAVQKKKQIKLRRLYSNYTCLTFSDITDWSGQSSCHDVVSPILRTNKVWLISLIILEEWLQTNLVLGIQYIMLHRII